MSIIDFMFFRSSNRFLLLFKRLKVQLVDNLGGGGGEGVVGHNTK